MAYTSQPGYNNPVPGSAEWQNGLCSCCSSCRDCWYACCCPCIYAIVAGDASGTAENKNWGYVNCLAICFLQTTLPFFVIRKNVREQKGIDGSILGDICVSCCCGRCAMIQAKREFD